MVVSCAVPPTTDRRATPATTADALAGPRTSGPGAPPPDCLPERQAARTLGLTLRELRVAVRLGHLATVAADTPWRRRVPRAEIHRVRCDPGFPATLRARIRLVTTAEGAALLGIGPARFHRLARGGCFAPLTFSRSPGGSVVWHYPAVELRLFARHRPELLSGRTPRPLTRLLRAGADARPRRWRGRLTSLLAGQARTAWEQAAVPAAVLDRPTLAAAVPDPRERAVLGRLRPPLTDEPTGEPTGQLSVAREPEEIRWYHAALRRALAEARARPAAPGPPRRVTSGPRR